MPAAMAMGLAMGLAMVLGVGLMAQAPAELKVGDMALDFSLQGTDGKLHTLADYRDKKAVVVATWPTSWPAWIRSKAKAAT